MNSLFLSRIATLRWLAALIAVSYHVRFLLFANYGHVAHKGMLTRLFYFVTSLGHESFIAYMVLSGLLLGGLPLSRWRRGADPRPDLWRNGRKVYLLLVPALAAGGLLDVAGGALFAESGVYAALPQSAPTHLTPFVLFGNLLLLQDIVVPGFGSNAMLFLLAYEAWAYVVLATAFSLGPSGLRRGCAVAALLAAALVLVAPRYLGYLAAWLLGLAVAAWAPRWRGRVPGWAGAAVLFAVLLASRVAGARLAALPLPYVSLLRLLLDMMVAGGLAVFLSALYGIRGRRARPGTVARLRRRLAGLGLPLYATQFPFMAFAVALANTWLGLPLAAQPSAGGLLAFALVIGAIYLFALLAARASAALAAMFPSGAAARWGRQWSNAYASLGRLSRTP